MFGQGYKRETALPVAGNGVYDVKIEAVRQRNVNGYNFLEFTFSYSDGVPKNPKTFSLFEARPEQGAKGQSDFNIRATRIFDCFGLNAGFDDKTIASWVGHVGKVEIGTDNKGFAVVKKFLPNLAAQEAMHKVYAPKLDGMTEQPSIY